MTRSLPGLALAVLLASAPASAAAELWVGAAAGGGWDSNVNLGVSGTTNVPAGFGFAEAHGGAGLGLGEWGELSLEVAWDSTLYFDLSDLDLHRPSALAAFALELGPSLRLRLTGETGLRIAADPDREGWDGSVGLHLRYRPHPRFALRAAGIGTRREASDSSYSGDSLRLKGGAEVRFGEDTWLAGGYQVDLGDATVSTAAGTGTGGGGAGRGQGRMTSSYGVALVSERVTAAIHAVTGSLTVPLGAGFAVELAAAHSWIRARTLTGQATSATGSILWSY